MRCDVEVDGSPAEKNTIVHIKMEIKLDGTRQIYIEIHMPNIFVYH